MLATLIIWSYTGLLLFSYGRAATHIFQYVFGKNSEEKVSLPFVLLIGLVVLTVFASILNVFIPLGAASAVIFLAGGVFGWLASRRQVFVLQTPRHPLTWILLAFIALTVLENATHPPSSSDTALYHAQTIRWFETYQAVPGLGNLHHRLAFNSSWLVINAAFSFAFLGVQSFHPMSGILFLCSMLYFTEGLETLITKKRTTSAILKVLLLPLSFYLLSSDISSPATDMPVTLLTWVILVLWVEELETGGRPGIRIIGVFILSFFTLTIKLSAIPLLGFAGFILTLYIFERQWQKVLLLGLAGMVILLPWIVRSVILSGYLVFPVTQIDFFPVDWKIPIDQVESIRDAIFNFARFPGKDWRSMAGTPFREWVSLWFARQTINQQVVFLLAVISPLILLTARYKYTSIVAGRYILAHFILYAGVIFWFFSAPDLRFGYGFLIGVCILAISPFLASLMAKIDKDSKFIPQTIFVTLFVFQLYVLTFSTDTQTLKQRLVLPADYFRSRAQPCAIANGSVFCRVDEGQCNYEIFPCIPTSRPNVEMRGPTFHDGFRVVR